MGPKIGSKLRCMMKRWSSSSKMITRSASHDDDDACGHAASFNGDELVPAGLHPVYVGKSRRRYLVSSDLLDHPLFRVLIQRSDDEDKEEAATAVLVVGCEVVLFDHLLWMLENADPQPESLDELVDLYACC